jgi:hypothetical protein
LRLLRNATFHYQRDLLSWKHLQFFGTEEERTEVWLNALYRQFERFFAENTLPMPEELRAELKEQDTHVGIVKAIKQFWAGTRRRSCRAVFRGHARVAADDSRRTSGGESRECIGDNHPSSVGHRAEPVRAATGAAHAQAVAAGNQVRFKSLFEVLRRPF